ncbi:hypothetical protein BBK36DRAFT_1166077 [Trichoderma citrinoviride]|uniref:Uncharacterized protein n=1 Tax=Trichoderma citrinoviride TaxID=58853 RepID=A0A2T4BKL6_9HYPO|nr:hypothetical protein BBK36DRAFT_1166077 [Trichoderma citrinoviride]PTB69853.1 hypothetical protein BBK36DRAFT_1166077 [Trichoderma citrinoviride]
MLPSQSPSPDYIYEESITSDAVPDDPKESIEDAENLARADLFPWVDQHSNVITRHVGKALIRAHQEESKTWTWEMNFEFRHIAPTLNFSIYAQTGIITSHRIGKNVRKNGATWVHFWFLRVMFGPQACSRQPWFAELAEKHPWILNEAPGGVVPWSARAIIESGQEDWVPVTPIMETPIFHTITRPKREAAESISNPRPNKTPRASVPYSKETAGVSDETDVWTQLDDVDLWEPLNMKSPSKSDEQLEELKVKHEALQSAHEALFEKHRTLEGKYKKQEKKLEKLCTRLIQLGSLVKQQNGV